MATMSSPLTVKRRKLYGTSTALTKPFVSPLKTSKLDPTALKREQNGPSHTPYRPSMLAHTIAAAPPVAEANTSTSKPPGFKAAKSTPIRKLLTAFGSRTSRDPDELAAQKAITTLELQIRNVRSEVDTLAQAQRLSSSNRDAELEDLAAKWRAAAQNAAEEVFGTVKERVCRMGGVQAWRESEKRKFDRMHGFGEFAEKNGVEEDDDEDCEYDSHGEELPEEEAEWRKSEKRRIRKERREAMDEEVEGVDNGEGGQKGEMVWQENGAEDDVSVVLLLCFYCTDFGAGVYD